MSDQIDVFFNPARLADRWKKTETAEQNTSSYQEVFLALDRFEEFQRLVKGELGEYSVALAPIMEETHKLILQQNSTEGPPLDSNELQENQSKLRELFNQIEDLLDALYLSTRKTG